MANLKAVLSAALATLFMTGLYAADIDVDELRTSGRCTFQNFTGIYADETNTDLEIRKVGRRIGQDIWIQDTEWMVPLPTAYDNPVDRYVARRIYGDTKRGADIFMIGPGARVDTFQNLVRILSGYIEYAFRVPREKSDGIAELVLFYNGTHRNDFAFFNKNYTGQVLESFRTFSSGSLGISTNYAEWPGNTKIVIPLKFADGGPSAQAGAADAADAAAEASAAAQVQADVGPGTSLLDADDRQLEALVYLVIKILIGFVIVVFATCIVLFIIYKRGENRKLRR